MIRPSLMLALLGVLVAGCTARAPRPTVGIEAAAPQPTVTGWKAIATPEDQARLAALHATWTAARASIRGSAARKAAAAEGAVLDPDAGLDLPVIPPGPYSCRLLRLGGRTGFRTFKPDICYVQGDEKTVSLTKQSGENLPSGWLFPDTDRRLVFLGSSARQATLSAPSYNTPGTRSIAGIVDRFAPFHWRLVLTQAGGGAEIDLYELVPIVQDAPLRAVTPSPPKP